MKSVNVYRTISEAFSFAISKFETCIRVAWLPICLILLLNFAAPFMIYSILFGRSVSISDAPSWYVADRLNENLGQIFAQAPVMAGGIFLILGICLAILYASYFIDLFRFAALGESPSSNAFSLRFGRRHAGFILASGLGHLVVLLVVLPFMMGLAGASRLIEKWTQIEDFVAFPDSQSLHYAVLDVHKTLPWFSDILTWGLTGLMALLVSYLSIRLIPLPFFVAAKSVDTRYNSLKATLAVSRGFGIFKLLLVYAVIAVLIWLILYTVANVVMPLIVNTLAALHGFLGVSAQLATGSDHFPGWVRSVIMAPYLLVHLGMNIVVITFVSSILAGFGASLFSQFNPQLTCEPDHL